MAGTVGSLVVHLSAHIAEFTSGLQTAAAQAQTTAASISTSLASIKMPRDVDDMLTGKTRTMSLVGDFGKLGLGNTFGAKFGSALRSQQEDLKSQAAAIVASLQTPQERYAATVEKLNSLLGKGYLSSAMWARGISLAQDQLKAFTPVVEVATSRLSNLFRILGQATIGRRATSLIGNLASEASAVMGISAAALGIAVAFTAGAFAAKKLGDTILADKARAIELGVTYEELAQKIGAVTFSAGAESGLESMSLAFTSMWDTAKKITGEILGWAAYLLVGLPASGISAGYDKLKGRGYEPLDFSAQGKLDKNLQNEVAYSKAYQAALEGVDNIFGDINDKANNLGKTGLQVAIEKAKEFAREMKLLGGELDSKIDEVTESWNRTEKAAKEARDAAIGFFEAMNRPVDYVGDAMEESIQKAGADAEKYAERLAETGKRLAETPLDRFAANLDALYAALELGTEDGGINRKQFDAALGKLREQTHADIGKEFAKPVGAASALMGGSRELANAIADASVHARSPELEVARQSLRQLEIIAAKNAQESAIP